MRTLSPSVPPVTPQAAAAALWRAAALPDACLHDLGFTGPAHALPSSFAVTTAAQASIGVAALAAAALWQARGGTRQQVTVDGLHAAVAFRSERYFSVAGLATPEPWDRIAGLYPCADGWVRLHTNFAHHREGVLALLGCAYARDAVRDALAHWPAGRFEDEAAARGLVVAAVRSFEAWEVHPQAAALGAQPVVSIERIGAAPPRPLPPGADPLDGIRVLDLTRIIAGPVCGRTLAAHGADVLLVTAAHLPSIEATVIDTGRGKRACNIDLRDAAGCCALRALLARADVFVQGYRPGALQALGFGAPDCAALHPGVVVVSLSAYGGAGPWSGRRGFDSLVQSACGLNVAEAQAAGEATPKALPAQALDHAAGYLMAFGAMTALRRRCIEGGSWHVQVSLARTARWLRELGRVPDGLAVVEPAAAAVDACCEDSDSGFGRLRAVRHPARMRLTPPGWRQPSVPLGTHAPAW